MKIRDCLGGSVLALCIMSLACFTIIFMVGFLIVAQHDRLILDQIPLKMSNFKQWGQIPGTLNYTYLKTFTLFNLTELDDTYDNVQIRLNSTDPITYNVTKNFSNSVYDQQKHYINYTQDYKYIYKQNTSVPQTHDLDTHAEE